ncbi:MAG: hypothetical protein AAGA95_10740 [Pseudomonadota bacterium]
MGSNPSALAPASFSSTRRLSLWARWLIAGPLTIVTAILVMAGAPTWLPEGPGGVDHIAFPILLFPAIWAGLFLYALMESRQWRSFTLMLVLCVLNAIPVIGALRNMASTA